MRGEKPGITGSAATADPVAFRAEVATASAGRAVARRFEGIPMRVVLPLLLAVTMLLVLADTARAQGLRLAGSAQAPGIPQAANEGGPASLAGPLLPASAGPYGNGGVEATQEGVARPPARAPLLLQEGLTSLQAELAAARSATQKDEKLAKRVELLEKQIEVQQKMIRLLAEQMKKAPPPPEAVEKLELQVATLDARSKQAAQRDQDVALAVNNLTDHLDSLERNGPRLPATLKELFLPSRTNETPLSIYGSFVENYTQFNGKPPVFSTPDFAPFFFLQLNDRFLLAANVDITNAGVSVGEAQANWFATDWLTVVLGRYLTPIGFFNERLNHEWINRLPDVPLMFRQVSPLSSTDGLMLRGATYLFCSPVKLEYMLYGGNALQAASPPTTLSQVANLENITGGPDETVIKTLGGRIGFWVPAWGLTGGVSTYFNGRYSSAASDQFNLWQLDLGYRRGNWDARFEYANTYQQAASYIGNNIRRQGFYAQVAYRPYHLAHCILRNFEVAFRYSRVWFHGIDPTMLDPTTFNTLVDVPVNRDQYTVGLNYYFYPSMALRLAYEVNHEFAPINLHDNVFLGQFVWAF
jgi:hypothetical protein